MEWNYLQFLSNFHDRDLFVNIFWGKYLYFYFAWIFFIFRVESFSIIISWISWYEIDHQSFEKRKLSVKKFIQLLRNSIFYWPFKVKDWMLLNVLNNYNCKKLETFFITIWSSIIRQNTQLTKMKSSSQSQLKCLQMKPNKTQVSINFPN
jgi:hypothetical protein